MIEILLFAGLREKTGLEKIEWREAPITVAELKQQLRKQHVDLPSLDGVMFAVNERYAHDATEVSEGDTVALIPPVSGG